MSTQHDVAGRRTWDAVAVSGANTYYSGATNPKEGGGNAIGSHLPHAAAISYVFLLTGTMNGTLTLEVSNASDADILMGVDTWVTYSLLSGGGFTAGVASVTTGQVNSSATFGVRVKPGFSRSRWKYVNSTNSGTITATTTIKGQD